MLLVLSVCTCCQVHLCVCDFMSCCLCVHITCCLCVHTTEESLEESAEVEGSTDSGEDDKLIEGVRSTICRQMDI